jgi:colanic acid/amylovoran biosynthesis protein
MNILITGQCSLHWGRMEFGNIGNYYIIEPMVRGIHKVFPNSTIKTTFQLSDRFCRDENISCIPMELYYDFNRDTLSEVQKELSIATEFSKTGKLTSTTPYIDECINSDLVIDFSGDIWGDNANLLGENRFLIGLIKDRIPQLLGKKTVMLAGSPGPFKEQKTLEFAKEVYKNFDLVTNRESISVDILNEERFDTTNTKSLACPAFLFEPLPLGSDHNLKIEKIIENINKPIVGFIICGWNFIEGPYDKWPREDSEYTLYAEAVEYISEKLDCHVLLLSHSNGFVPNKNPFELIHGRDFVISEQLNRILNERGIAKNYSLVTDVLDTWQTKGLVGEFDMLVSGRIHGAVAGLSQLVPTVIIDYGHEPKAHKLRGFSIEAGVENCIANPMEIGDIITKTNDVFYKLEEYKSKLENQIPRTKEKSLKHFQLLQNLINEYEVYTHLKKCDESFKPALHTYLNIKDYSTKITNKALLFKKYDENSNLIGLIAIYDKKPVKHGYLTNFSIDPMYTGKGVGSSLLDECIEYFKLLDYNLIRLEVFNVNDRAIRFYEKYGFEMVNQNENKTELKLKL